MNLLELAERVEKATGAFAETDMLRLAHQEIFGDNQDALALPVPDFREWDARATHFWRLIGAGASLDAAMTLVPAGWDWDGGAESGKGRATVMPPSGTFTSYAATPALALCAACLRAIAALTPKGDEL